MHFLPNRNSNDSRSSAPRARGRASRAISMTPTTSTTASTATTSTSSSSVASTSTSSSTAAASMASTVSSGTFRGGSLGKFKPDVSSWEMYAWKMEQYLMMNHITDDKAKKAVLFLEVGEDNESILWKFCGHASPDSKTFQELCNILKNYHTIKKAR